MLIFILSGVIRRNLLKNLEGREKVFPFGLNYENYAGNFDRFLLARSKFYQGKEKLKIVLKTFGGASGFNIFEDLPRPQIEPKVIFMARAWNPEKIEDKKQKAQTEAINETRAECVRLLRKEFGARFFGGLAVDDYSEKNFKDCLLPNETVSKQSNILKSSKISRFALRQRVCAVLTVGNLRNMLRFQKPSFRKNFVTKLRAISGKIEITWNLKRPNNVSKTSANFLTAAICAKR